MHWAVYWAVYWVDPYDVLVRHLVTCHIWSRVTHPEPAVTALAVTTILPPKVTRPRVTRPQIGLIPTALIKTQWEKEWQFP